MIKKILIFKIFTLILFFSIGADAALQWKVGAFLGTFASGVAIAFGLAGAAPIVVAGTLAVGVHAAVIGLYWDDINPPQIGGGSASLGLSIVIDANTPFITPPGWTTATIGQKEPLPPNTEPYNEQFYVNIATFAQSNNQIQNIQYYPTYADALTALESVYFIATTNTQNPSNTIFTGHHLDNPDQTSNNTGTNIQRTRTCPTGYGIDNNNAGNNCIITDSTLVSKPIDDVCEVAVFGGTLNASPNDPDCDITAAIGLGSSTVTVATPNKAVYVATSANGSVTVYEKTYNSSNNTTSLSTANFNPSSDLDFIQTANSLGNNVGINPVNGGTGVGAGTGDAKDSSLNVVDGGDEPIGNPYSSTGGVTAPENGIQTSLNPFKNWTLPINLGQCPTGTFEIFNKSIELNSHCAIFDQNSNIIKQAMGVVFTITALFIILGA